MTIDKKADAGESGSAVPGGVVVAAGHSVKPSDPQKAKLDWKRVAFILLGAGLLRRKSDARASKP